MKYVGRVGGPLCVLGVELSELHEDFDGEVTNFLAVRLDHAEGTTMVSMLLGTLTF